MVEVILKFKPPYEGTEETLQLMAAYANATFGEGGDPDSSQIEGYVGNVNTPPQNGHVRLRAPAYYAMALEYIEANGGSVYASLVWVGWPGGDPEPDLSWPIFDENGVEIGRQGLGRFA